MVIIFQNIYNNLDQWIVTSVSLQNDSLNIIISILKNKLKEHRLINEKPFYEDIIDKLEDNHIEQDEKNIELLCIYLKQSIALQAKNNNKNGNDNIFYRYKNKDKIISSWSFIF